MDTARICTAETWRRRPNAIAPPGFRYAECGEAGGSVVRLGFIFGKKGLASAKLPCIVSRLIFMAIKSIRFWFVLSIMTMGLAFCASASEADIHIPQLDTVKFAGLGGVSGHTLMMLGIVVCAIGALFGIVQYLQTKGLPVHESMAKVSHSIYETCKTYLLTQGKLLAILWILIAGCMVVYFKFLQDNT